MAYYVYTLVYIYIYMCMCRIVIYRCPAAIKEKYISYWLFPIGYCLFPSVGAVMPLGTAEGPGAVGTAKGPWGGLIWPSTRPTADADRQ